ncbi:MULTISPECIES: lipopolysaccharide biosynthesis protein [Sphingomonadales]|uniref:Polysaccharide biosynthesis protein n=2 Tax=Edaphosphingomonas TaxID=3423724 RepID=A0A2T4I0E2_9SPHN|nr:MULTISPECIES: lipopolysaccharide biosynthesis protein [Sphingomonas]AGH50068.1 polysaccharide biosynthesis protein [Sphingomonas sp. MM-1]MDX3883070.1 lipopolysaccharide biosynthesis protein [Sphingomonas sp.]OHT18426.1 Polysaccharide biosynthesis protein [Sphingomonas haloaromaticamans]PTD22099.1 polysaccharide biosynthesis protein [Sphingomonas fennica]
MERPGSLAAAEQQDDIADLAKGGRTNFFGFLLRLVARIPFLFIAGRLYGPTELGRFALAILVLEFAAQLATLGLKRGLAQQLSRNERPHVHIVWDALLIAGCASAIAAAILAALPQLMFPNSKINGLEQLMPLIIFAIAWSDVSLAALAYRHNVAATVRARAIIEPWTISIAAFGFYFYSQRDGLILAYALSMVAALAASLYPFIRAYGLPRGWHPEPRPLFAIARRNMPLAAADAIEWGTRNVDRFILGLFFPPATVGIYWVAQQIVTLPQKLKTSFDPILGPVITQNLEAGNKAAVAAQVRQVGFWIIAAQAGIALSLSIPGEAVMGLAGPEFVGGTAALAFLLLAEVVAATAVVSESALIYIARHRNLMISLATISLQVALSFAFILGARALGLPLAVQAVGPAVALPVALGFASIAKARLLSKLLGAPVSGWRWALIWAAAAAAVVGFIAIQVPEWLELTVGVPLILLSYGLVIWYKGFTPEDRVLFKLGGSGPAPLASER